MSICQLFSVCFGKEKSAGSLLGDSDVRVLHLFTVMPKDIAVAAVLMLPDVHHVIALYYLLTYCSFDTRQV